MTNNKPELFELSALLQRQAQVVESLADNQNTGLSQQDQTTQIYLHMGLIYSYIECVASVVQETLSEKASDYSRSIIEVVRSGAESLTEKANEVVEASSAVGEVD